MPLESPLHAEQDIVFKTEFLISVPKPTDDNEKRMGIRRADWNRLKRNCSRLEMSQPRLSIAYSILFGAGITAGLSILPLWGAEGLPTFVIPLYACFCGFSVFLGGILIWLERILLSHRASEVKRLKEDMDEIQKAFENKAAVDG